MHAVEGSPVISRIQKSGKLLVGTSGNMPLMSEKLMTGGLVGFDIDMAKAACDTMGVELELKTIPFDQLIPALEQGTVDVVLSSMTTAADRNMRVAIASPCFVSGKCLITKEQGIAQTDSPEDLEGADVLFAAIRDSTSSKFYEYPTG